MIETTAAYIGASELERLSRKNDSVTLIDARTTEEFAAVHVPGAVNVSISGLAEHVRNRRPPVISSTAL